MITHEPAWTPDKILHAALEKEQQAHDFYEEMANHCSVDFVAELLLKLQNEESKHVHMIKDMLARMEIGRNPVS
jgi:rubrerythrin